MTDLSHQQIANAASVWLSKPFSVLVAQELSTTSWGWSGNPKFQLDVVGVTPNAQRITVVECKASRADFKRGLAKLEIYRTFCHHLYVAAPTGMLQKEELPDGIGLLTVGPRGKARMKYGAVPREMSADRYALIMERVLQKVIVSRASWANRRPGMESQHWPGDGCEDDTLAIRGHLKHQADLYEMAFGDWIMEVERKEPWLDREVTR